MVKKKKQWKEGVGGTAGVVTPTAARPDDYFSLCTLLIWGHERQTRSDDAEIDLVRFLGVQEPMSFSQWVQSRGKKKRKRKQMGGRCLLQLPTAHVLWRVTPTNHYSDPNISQTLERTLIVMGVGLGTGELRLHPEVERNRVQKGNKHERINF